MTPLPKKYWLAAVATKSGNFIDLRESTTLLLSLHIRAIAQAAVALSVTLEAFVSSKIHCQADSLEVCITYFERFRVQRSGLKKRTWLISRGSCINRGWETFSPNW